MGMRVLAIISEGSSPDSLNRLADEISNAEATSAASQGFWSATMQVPIVLAFLVAFFNQMSGINAILYFAPGFLR